MSEWIPVSERLPEKGTTVLVQSDMVMYVATYEPNIYEDMPWFSGEIGFISADAWMPLPEPYREDERSDERVGALIDVIEDFLAERGVRLPESVEDDAACGGAVVICGGDYDALASKIKEFFGDGNEPYKVDDA